MPEPFLQLGTDDRRDILLAAAQHLGRDATILEKDVWVCWVLEHLFAMPGSLAMAFKGGTSLSKVYRAIDRFSEDIDITIDHTEARTGIDPFERPLSRNQRDVLNLQLRTFVASHLTSTVQPHLEAMLAQTVPGKQARIERANDETLLIHYPSAINSDDTYIPEAVTIEFGGRNSTLPNDLHPVEPDMVGIAAGLTFPKAQVNVLSPVRTFWEKATLAHVCCVRGDFRPEGTRQSRHWYDLARLADHAVGQEAIQDRHLLSDVVRHKKVFFHYGNVDYDDCVTGGLRLIPEAADLAKLRQDYGAMLRAQMFYGEAPAFEAIVARLQDLAKTINAR